MRLFEEFDNMRLADPHTYLSVIQNRSKTLKMVHGNGRVRQVDVYCLFKDRFGPPNGIQSFLRGDHSNNIFHWHYSLTLNGIFIDVLSSTRFLEFHVISSDPVALTKFNGDDLLSSLIALISKKKEEISVSRERLEFWHVFLNTYKRLESTTDYYFEQYSKVEYREPVLASHIASEREVKIYNHQMKKFIEKIMLKRNYGIVLRMLYPVQSESLVNLILFVLAKQEIRSDKRLLENAFREQIDIRVKTLHLKCDGLISPYDQNDDRFKNFLRMMDKRNDFLHGNVLPSRLKFDKIYFDGTVPLFLDDKNLAVEFTIQNLFQVSKSEVETENRTVKEFKEFLLDNIENNIRPQVELIVGRSQLGWNTKTGRIGDLFDDEIVEAIFIRK